MKHAMHRPKTFDPPGEPENLDRTQGSEPSGEHLGALTESLPAIFVDQTTTGTVEPTQSRKASVK